MFNPSRLTLARQRRGLTKTRLAEQVSIAARSITAYEAGDTEPAMETLEKLAAVLDFPADFFSAGDIEAPTVQGVSFRSLKSLTSGRRDAALGAGALAIELSTWIEARFSLPDQEIPDLADQDPETAAASVRAMWGLGERPIRNVIHLLESRGVRIFSLAEECHSVDAFSFWRNGTPFVFLNTQKSGERSRMDAAHELGHLVRHRRDLPRDRDFEREAQRFAGAFLMPRASVLAEVTGLITADRLIKLKRIWGVAATALCYRLHELGLLSDWQYRSLFTQLSARGYRRDEPDPMNRESSLVLEKVFDALRSERIDQRAIARDLRLSPGEINKLVFGLAFVAIDGRARSTGAADPSRNPKLSLVRPRRDDG